MCRNLRTIATNLPVIALTALLLELLLCWLSREHYRTTLEEKTPEVELLLRDVDNDRCLSLEEVGESLRSNFSTLDLDHNGLLCEGELRQAGLSGLLEAGR